MRTAPGEPDVEIVGECKSGTEAVAAIRARRPDVVFLDVQMPGGGGFEVLADVGVAAMAVIFVTAHAATPGWSCIDPLPAGGTDPYCGLCLKGEIVCHGDNRDQCNPEGTAFVTLEPCTWGCLGSSASCCAEPDCGGRICGGSATNACGRSRSCGPCTGSCCDDGFQCCGGNTFCCGSSCCPFGSCCDFDSCTSCQ